MTDQPPIVIEPAGTPSAVVIMLHGLGAGGSDFEPLVPALDLPDASGVRFILPHAPVLPVTLNGGMTMPAWYDIRRADLDREIDEAQLRDSARYVQRLIDEQIAAGIDSEQIVVAGFSQGGAVAYEAALSCPEPLAGVLALSTYFATADSITLSDANRGLPIAIHHGSQDPIVDERLGQRAAERLEALGYSVEYHSWPMAHTLIPDQLPVLREWLLKRLGDGRAR
ncbi:alpha/beta hydrolase [Kushneria aurantia]|uniref:Alpha/beta hydrolase n=1 Tax=Kushneria aurantia TaxID=504092 RepID=A0ABV6G3E3_9GAMM|nr:alpha/beta fold hydrolase [Kushneria aurantia]